VSLLAALAAAVTVAPGADDRCIACGGSTSVHMVAGRWIGCLPEQQPQPEPRELVRLPKLLHFPTRRLDVHAGSVAQRAGGPAMGITSQSERV
jgi:hypothetical protein